MLLDDSGTNTIENVCVIPIAGFGGLGKTTLIQLVYNNGEVTKYFNFKKWVCVANDSSDKTLLGEVFRVICESHLAQKTVQMQEGLQEKLSGKKFLLVLDDVWNSDKWEDLKVILKCGAHGSKVIVTTRIEKVANEMGTISSLHLGKLPEAHCRVVFEKRAFRMGGPEKTRDLEKVGWKIVEKRGGVPLAVKALGSLMHSKKTLNEWKAIQNSENINVVGDNVMNVLRLSYDHLSSPLKQCFRYCAIFPKDTEIMKNDLIQQWVAQGFIRSLNDSEMEEVGNDYFKTLCWNSFFQNLEVDKDNEVISCKMHDIVHDLAQSIMGKEMLVSSHTTMTENLNIGEPRHLVMLSNDMERHFAIPKNLYQAKKLRTFFSRRNEANDAWCKFKFIRVLHLEGIKEVSSSIGKLKLLRYLCIKSQRIEVLPLSICQLYYLETLNVEHCRRLEVLPRDTWKLANLRHLYIGRNTKLPKWFGRLCCLQTISPFLCLGEENDECGIGELEHLNNISGHLRIDNMEKVRNTIYARKAKLREKEKIHRLQMLWGSEHANDNIADGIRNNYSCSNLESINVRGLTSLETLKITHCKGLKSSIIGLQSLQALKYLTLQKVPIIMLTGFDIISGECCWPHLETLNISSSRNVTLTTQFPSLRVIEISSIDSFIIEPVATNKDLASLTRLNIVGVKNLTSLPRGLLQNCSMSLKKLRIQNCPMFQGFIQHELLLLTSLVEFCIKSCPVLSSLELSSLVSLTKLKITDCKGIKSSPFPPENLQCLPSLQSLSIGGFSEELDHLPFPAVQQNNNDSLLCSSLQQLKICGWSKIKSLPHQLQHLTALQLLDMRQFDSSAALPEWIGNLSSLQQLDISDSRGPMRLPSKQQLQRLTSLGSITITNCPLLSERLITDYEERCKISDKYDLSHDRIGHCTHLSLNWSEIARRYGSTTRRPF